MPTDHQNPINHYALRTVPHHIEIKQQQLKKGPNDYFHQSYTHQVLTIFVQLATIYSALVIQKVQQKHSTEQSHLNCSYYQQPRSQHQEREAVRLVQTF